METILRREILATYNQTLECWLSQAAPQASLHVVCCLLEWQPSLHMISHQTLVHQHACLIGTRGCKASSNVALVPHHPSQDTDTQPYPYPPIQSKGNGKKKKQQAIPIRTPPLCFQELRS